MSKGLESIEQRLTKLENTISILNHLIVNDVLPALRNRSTNEITINQGNSEQQQNISDDVSFYDVSTGSLLSIDDTTVHSGQYVPPQGPNKATQRARKIQARAEAIRRAKRWGEEDKRQLEKKRNNQEQRK